MEMLLGMVAVILAVTALLRAAEVSALRDRIKALESRLRSLESGSWSRRVPPTDLEEPAPDDATPGAARPPEPPVERKPAARELIATLASEPAPEPPRTERPKKETTEESESGESWTLPDPDSDPAREPEPAEPRSGIEWERWLGVRGFAVVGGIVLALAAILLFQHAASRGWVTPWVRVAMGWSGGVVCILLGDRRRFRELRWVPAALQGAGIVALYAATWASSKLYGMLSPTVGFALMAAITATGCALALRGDGLLTAVLALVGGFATPVLLSTGEDRPIALFSYLLVLDLGLMFVGRRRRWPVLGLLAMLGTLGFEAFWIVSVMGAQRMPYGFVILTVFSGLFAFVSPRGDADSPLDRATRYASLLVPFVFAFYFARSVDFGDDFAWVLALCALLGAASCWLAIVRQEGPLAMGAAAASIGVVVLWIADADLAAVAWSLPLVLAPIAVSFFAFAEWEARRVELVSGRAVGAAAIVVLGGLGICAAVTPWLDSDTPFWPAMTGLVLFAALGARLSVIGNSQAVYAGAVTLGLGCLAAARVIDGQYLHGAWTHAMVVGAIGAAYLVLGFARRDATAARHAWQAQGLALVPALLSVSPVLFRNESLRIEFGVVLLALTALGSVGAVFGRSPLLLAVMLAIVGGQAPLWVHESGLDDGLAGDAWIHASLCFLMGVTPAICALLRSRVAWPGCGVWRVAAVGAVLLWPATEMFAATMADSWTGFAAIALGLTMLAIARALAVETGGPEPVAPRTERTIALAWVGSVSAIGIAVGLARQIGVVEVAVTPALAALGLAAVATTLRHPPVSWLVVSASATAAVVLIYRAAIPHTWAHSEVWLWSEIHFAHLVPVALLLGVAKLLRNLHGTHPTREGLLAAATSGGAAVVVLFVWINVATLDYFSESPTLAFRFERLPARDVTTSVLWAVYALVLLGFGVARHSIALRWTSLALLLLTLGKVFLHDLGELDGLYRVGSLVGLAVSLLAVSVLYQRVVFRPAAPE